jgi:hypothetical protein
VPFGIEQIEPHAPQFFASVAVVISQPFVGSLSQSPKPSSHAPTTHAAALHAAVAWATAQAMQLESVQP